VVGAVSSITATNGTPQSTVVGTAFPTMLSAIVEDQFGDPISGVTVTFAAPSSGAGGSFASGKTTTAMTNSLGVATAPAFTANTSAGSYLVNATVSGVSTPASFSLSNTAGVVSSITDTAGSPQSTVVNTAFATALKATVEDQFGNPVSGVSVTFAAPTSGASGDFSGTMTTTATATTNSLGVATAPVLTANTSVGGYTVSATVSGVSSVASFSLTNTAKTSTTLTIQPKIVMLGHAVTFTATVAAVAPAVGQPAGSVSFFNGSKLLGSAMINNLGQAVLMSSTLGLGVHSITAIYAGDPSDLTSGSVAVSIRVGGTVAGDFDGDGKSDIAIYDQTSATFYIRYSSTGVVHVQPFGNPSDKNIAVMGDFDGDGKTDIAIYDQTAGVLLALETGSGTIAMPFGSPADLNIPIAGDFDGDGKADIAIFDASASEFLVLESGGGIIAMPFGNNKHANRPV
jgi:Bacterial Ig-like domain (group 3)/FG-GAP-like repeat